MNLKLELQSNKSCSIYSAGKFWTDSFNIFQHSLLFSDWFKDKKWKILNKNWFYSCLPFPMQLHRTEYERHLSVLWLFLATVACYLNCLSVQSLHTHSEHWQDYRFFSVLISQTNTKHSTPSTSSFCHNCREANCFQATPTLLTIPQYVFISLRYQPFLINVVSPFPFPHNERPWRLT